MIKHDEFLEVAIKLIEDSPSNDSAFIRSSISRAYYYIFHYAMEKLKKHPKARFHLLKNKACHHKYIIELLYELKQLDIAERIGKFRRVRNDADYDLNRSFDKSEAERWINHARWITANVSKRKEFEL